VHVPFGGDGEDCAHGVGLDNWGEGLRVIASYSLTQSMDNGQLAVP
jgi:hypothetical protein